MIRIVAGTAYGSHTAPLFYKLNIQKFEQIKLYQSGEFMYRYDHNLLPSVYNGFLVLLLKSIPNQQETQVIIDASLPVLTQLELLDLLSGIKFLKVLGNLLH